MQTLGENFSLSTNAGMPEDAEAGDNRAELGPVTSPENALDRLRKTADRATDFADAARAASTKRAYRADLNDFARWCADAELCALPAAPQTLALYLTDLSTRAKVSTLRRRLVAINGAHREREFESATSHPAVRAVLAGIARTHGTVVHKKSALTIDLLRESLATLDGSLRGTRDRALLLLGFAGGFRRSEIVALDVADLKFSRRGLAVLLRQSKTDQERQGRQVPVPSVPVAALCPVKAVRTWLQVARIEAGPVFRTIVGGAASETRIEAKTITRLVKRVVGEAGLEGDFAAHSLRSGFASSAASKKVALHRIAHVTGHRSQSVLAGYIQHAGLFDDPALLEIMR